MSEQSERRSEVAEGMRRGIGWAIGLGIVVGVGSAVGRGGRATLKEGVKGVLRAREAGSELTEKLQDVYAEAQAEYTSARFAEEDDEA